MPLTLDNAMAMITQSARKAGFTEDEIVKHFYEPIVPKLAPFGQKLQAHIDHYWEKRKADGQVRTEKGGDKP